jgi:hypothetical protein
VKSDETQDDALILARAYLAGQLGERAPDALEPVARFDGQPLEGEGATTLFRFLAAPDGGELKPFWVAAGRTEPNYYPDWGLVSEDMYSIHIGTRFMLVMEIAQQSLEGVGEDVRAWFVTFLNRLVPGASVETVELLAAFRVEDDLHVVARARVAAETVVVIGVDAPPGVCLESHLPPHVLYRRHLGRLILREWEESRRKPVSRDRREG